ncbi:MAG TPA: SirA family protein [Aminobacterium sp.]|jgi:tRNA 2-thiouridine synthesizing protein A|uniref:sulfurtransferase TusA family protein n=1 Tax=Aminobacterium TaxID=81466 RepID=UPI000464DFF2|nr:MULTISPECIES: sulfurtransferase TusA family protein [Aminobacterium]HCA41306.1 SirA family protein [Aminobacterium sp.]
MSESRIVDARGLSCPQPVLETRKVLKDLTGGRVEILVDTVTSRENVARFGRSQKWNVAIDEFEGGYKVILTK